MSRIRGSGTGPERAVEAAIVRAGLRRFVRQHRPTGADFAWPGLRVALFVDGCFWHGCPEHCREPGSNRGYWVPKLRANAERDRRRTSELRAAGWRVIRAWEHEEPDAAAGRVREAIMERPNGATGKEQ